jgi:hypothetical protein
MVGKKLLIMPWLDDIRRWLCRLNDVNRIYDLTGWIQAAGAIIQILILIITGDILLKMFQINFNWIIYSFIIIAIVILTIVIWVKLGDVIRRFVIEHERIWIKILIACMFLLIILLVLNIFGIFPAPPPQPSLDPSGKMGDINDVQIIRTPEFDQFIYTAIGTTPHEWDWKYLDDHSLNSEPAQFGGVMYLFPPNNWGYLPGNDLRSYRKSITWEAKSVGDDCMVEFVIGGIQWKWENGSKSSDLKYPDSMPRKSLGIKTLTKDWQKFSSDLSDRPEENFSNVIGDFGWIIPWGSNNISLNENRTGSQNPRTFTIEIRNIKYHK